MERNGVYTYDAQTLNASPAVVVVTIPRIFPPLKNNETQMVMRNDSLSISTFPREIQSTYNLEFIRDSGDIRQIQPPSQITVIDSPHNPVRGLYRRNRNRPQSEDSPSSKLSFFPPFLTFLFWAGEIKSVF